MAPGRSGGARAGAARRPAQAARGILADAKSADWTRRFDAARTIGEGKLVKNFPLLLRLLEDAHEQVRISAVGSLRRLGLRKAVEPLIGALADPSEWVRVKVVEALGALGGRRDATLLSQFLENEEDDRVRATLLRVLGELGGRDLCPVIALYLLDPNDRVRANAVEALERLGDGDSGAKLRTLMNDRSNRVRANAARALFHLGEGDAVDTLKEMILSADDWMRASAAFVFGEIDTPESIPYLVRALSDRTWFVVKNVVKALARKGAAAVPKLVDCLKSKNSTVVVNAIAALAEIGGAEVFVALIPLLNHEDGDVREKAEEAVDLLRERSRDR